MLRNNFMQYIILHDEQCAIIRDGQIFRELRDGQRCICATACTCGGNEITLDELRIMLNDTGQTDVDQGD